MQYKDPPYMPYGLTQAVARELILYPVELLSMIKSSNNNNIG